MPSTYSPLLRLELIGAGEQSGLWGDTTNKNLGQLIEQAIAGVTTVSLSGGAGDYTLSALDGTYDESRSAVLKFTGNPSGTKNIIIPTETKLYVVRNDCGQTITVKTAAQVTGVTLLNGEATLVFCDGTNAVAGIATAGVGPTTVANGGTGATSFSGGFVKSPGGTGTLTSSAFVNAATELSGAVGVANGGTGATSFTAGFLRSSGGTAAITSSSISLGSDVSGTLLVANGGTGANTFNAGVVKTAGGTSGFTASAVSLTTEVSGTLPVGNGGTGQNTLTLNGVLVGNGTSPITSVAPGVNGTVLMSNGTSWYAGSVGGGGTVTSVGFSTGTTGLIVTGTNPITSSGTFTLTGTLKVENGGTGASSFGTNVILKASGTSAFSAATPLDIVNAIGSQPVQVATNATQLGNVAASSYVTTSTLSNYVTTSSLNSTLSGYLTTTGTAANSSQLGNVAASSYARRDANNTFSGTNDFTSGIIRSEAYNFTDNTSIYSNNGADFFLAIGGNIKMDVNGSGDLTIRGQGYKPGGGSWGVWSDERLKTNVQDLTEALAKITSLRPVSYDWKYDAPNEPTVGFIAQEVQSVLPNAITETNPTDEQKPFIPNGEKVFSIGWQNDMMAYLVGAIKELKAEVDALKAQLAAK